MNEMIKRHIKLLEAFGLILSFVGVVFEWRWVRPAGDAPEGMYEYMKNVQDSSSQALTQAVVNYQAAVTRAILGRDDYKDEGVLDSYRIAWDDSEVRFRWLCWVDVLLDTAAHFLCTSRKVEQRYSLDHDKRIDDLSTSLDEIKDQIKDFSLDLYVEPKNSDASTSDRPRMPARASENILGYTRQTYEEIGNLMGDVRRKLKGRASYRTEFHRGLFILGGIAFVLAKFVEWRKEYSESL